MRAYYGGYRGRWLSRLAGMCLRVVAVLVAMSFLGALLHEILVSVAAVTVAVLVGVLVLRWHLFRWRGW